MNPRHQRKTILKQIDQWERARCNKCHNDTPFASEMNCECKAAKEIRKLGQQYEAIAAAVRKGRVDKMLENLVKHGLSPERYRRLREEGVYDKGIAAALKMSRAEFHSWKEENALINEERREILRKWLPVAEANGITGPTYRKRIDNGEDYESAATRPLAQVPHNKKRKVAAK